MQMEIVQWLFLRLLSIFFLIAFVSLYVQLIPLFGKNGLFPLGPPDWVLKMGTMTGMLASVGALSGVYPTIFFMLCWIIYLLFVRGAKHEFLCCHWTHLLLELGLYAIFYSLISPPTYLMTLLIPIFLARFMLGAGVNKLFDSLVSSGHWKSLTAPHYILETQPLPNRVAYYLFKIPPELCKPVTLIIMALFFITPLLIFTPYSSLAFVAIVALQAAIWAIGNFPWINPLVMVAAVTVLPLTIDFPSGITFAPTPYLVGFLNLVCLVLIFLNILRLIADIFPRSALDKFMRDRFNQWRIATPYNLFKMVNDSRLEIVIEGSEDGKVWHPYDFKYKSINLYRAPSQITPHYPILDWKIWLAANFPPSWWFVPFLGTLLEGNAAVLRLLGHNPFPQKPPKYIRTLLFQYSFSSLETKRRTGQWWTRKFIRPFTPIYTLQDPPSPNRKLSRRRPIIDCSL